MAEKDIAVRRLAGHNDVFADIVNGCFAIMGDGRPFRRVEPDELRDVEPRTNFKIGGKLREQERDVIKLWEPAGAMICLMGLEHQTTIDPNMPLRVFAYEGGDYRQQYLRALKGHEPLPVLTFVLYFGTERRWTTNLTLLERLGIPQGHFLRPFLNDCRPNILEVAYLTAMQAAHFKSDFFFAVDYLRHVQMDKRYVPTDQVIRHVDAVLKLMAALTGDHSFENIPIIKGGEPMTVRNFFAEAKAEGISLGREQGISLGREQGIVLGREQGLAQGLNMIFSFVEDGLVPLAEAAKRANMSEDEFRARMRNRDTREG